MICLPAFTAKENYRIVERILGFTDAKTHRKRWIFRTKNMSKRLNFAAFSVNSIFVFRTVNAGFFAVSGIHFIDLFNIPLQG